jgi:hypothetical protein
MTPGFDFGAYLERSQGSVLPPTNRLLNRIRLDVHIATTPELQMQTASLRLLATPTCISGDGGSPSYWAAPTSSRARCSLTAQNIDWSAATSLY